MLYLKLMVIGILMIGPTLMVGSASAANATKQTALAPKNQAAEKQTEEERNAQVIEMAEKQLGLIVGPVTEDIRKELNLRSAEGVAIYEVVGDSLAEKAGIKVHAVIAEINKMPIRNLDDLGRLLPEALEKGNFTVSTWEPTNPENQGQGGQLNFHFVPKETD